MEWQSEAEPDDADDPNDAPEDNTPVGERAGEWTRCEITVDAREAEGLAVRRAHMRKRNIPEKELNYFLEFFPLEEWIQEEALLQMQREHDALQTRRRMHFTKGNLLKFLGVLIRMGIHDLKNIDNYWGEGIAGVKFGFEKYMSRNQFKQWWRYLRMPGDKRT